MTSEEHSMVSEFDYRRGKKRQLAILSALLAIPLLGMVTAFGIAPNTATEPVDVRTIVADLPTQVGSPLIADEEQAYAIHDRIRKGDTVASVLSRLGVDDADALSFLRTNSTAKTIVQELAPGRMVEARIAADGDLLALRMRTAADRLVKVVNIDGDFHAFSDAAPLDTRVIYRSGVIRSSLFAATDAAGVPDSIAKQIIKLFGTDIDFHRDLHPGDRFTVIYEGIYDGADMVRPGRLLAAEFSNLGQIHRLVYFDDPAASGDYFTPGGRSLKRAFLRSPLEFSRVSSGFSSARQHPIFNDWRAHKGVDFAAPIGTPVLATSDGMATFVGGQNGYGNVIELKHYGQYSTVYAHLSRFAEGMRTGLKVEQGDIIGYVGASGWATGPHLHYEFRINGAHQDPLGSAVPVAIPTSPQWRERFETGTQPLLAGLDMMHTLATTANYE